MIEVHNLTKRFGPTVAVDDVSFEVARGEVVGFLGPNGAGKTTTMRIVTCYLPADAGQVKVAGFDTFEHAVEVRQRIGYLPESAPLYFDMGVIEYLEFVSGMRGIAPAERGRRIRQMVEVCGLGPMLHKDIGQLSKGFRQRVGLAATLIHDPDVLVLDEPTTGLDPNQIAEIRELIKEIGRQKTVILSTHILPEVEATCSRVLIINEGRIVASGTTEELTRLAAGKSTTVVTLKAQPSEVEPKLRALEGTDSIRALDAPGPASCRYEVVTAGGAPTNGGIEEALFRLAVQNNWIMLELHTTALSLEQVFLQLTTGEKRS
jgi:ABC-2 type transport system ATP-binding protein